MKPIAKLTKRERAAILKDPDAKLSDLLEIAALDAIALQRQKRVKLDMAYYVVGPEKSGGKCCVCLAGAAMFRDLDIRSAMTSDDIGNTDLSHNMRRIDDARRGEFFHERQWPPASVADMISKALSIRMDRAPFRVYLQAARKIREAGL